MKILNSILLFSFILGSFSVFSQRNADKTVSFKQNIETILLNELTGEIIVKEKDQISSYNPENGEISWVVSEKEIGKTSLTATANKINEALSSPDLGKIFESDERLSFIPNTLFVEGVINAKDIIINAATGKVVFNSGEKTYRVVSSEFLQETGSFLFLATDGKVFSSILYDLNNGTELWTTELAPVDGFMKQISNMFSFKNTTSRDRLFITNDFIYTSINGNLYKLNRADGNIVWNTPYKINTFYLSQSENNLVIIKNSESILSSKQILNVLNAESGEPIWKDDIKTKYVSYMEDWPDKILIAHSSGFNFYNYSDGKKVWKKDADGSDIKRVISIGDDYLYITDKEMNLIDKNGQKLWKNKVEISDNSEDPVYYLGKVENNRVFYLTGTYGNMVDYTTGKKIWKKNIEFDKDRPLLFEYDEKTNAYLVYNDKKIFKFDPNAIEKPEPIAKLKEIKEDKTISGIDLFDWGVCMTGQSDVIGVGSDGKTIYHNTYKEPGGGKRKFLNTTGKVVSVGLGAASSLSQAEVVFYSRDENGDLHEAGRAGFDEKTKKAGRMAGEASNMIDQTLLSRTGTRFNALKQNREYAFVLTKGEKGENPLLVKVRKSDGEEVDKIEIDNNKPLYEVDPVTDDIFYAVKTELRIFSKK